MASLIEVIEWVEELYQLEQEDLVIGGPDGIDNLQAKQLGARTRWLKQQIEAAVADSQAHIQAADPHPQYATEVWVTGLFNDMTNGAPTALDQLNEFAAALGNDANFSATILAQLALKAPLDSPEFINNPKAPTQAPGKNDTTLSNTAFVQDSLSRRSSLVNLLFPSLDGGWRDIFRSGWIPGWFNQQWGGAQVGHEMVDAATGTVYRFEPATGSIQDDSTFAIGAAASNTRQAAGFKVSDGITPPGFWVKLWKTGNPTDDVQVQVWSENAGSPNAALGAAGSIPAKLITSKADGEWYFIPVACPALVAGTQYQLVLSRSGAIDAANFVSTKTTSNRKYPHGFNNQWTGAAWVQQTGYQNCFLVPNPAAASFLQAGGQFDQKLVFSQANPVDQSKMLCQPLRNFFDGKNFTYLVRGTWPKGYTLADFVYGLDHDRIRIYTDANGYLNATIYTQAGAAETVTGNVDVSVQVGGKDHDCAIVARLVGDGADYLKAYVDGASQGAPLVGKTYTMDPLMRELGTAIVGGGVPAAPAWSAGSLSSFAALPSANGWTWAGTGAEANCMSVAGGKLYQNKNGYGATDTGYYLKAAAGLNNATGWTIAWKNRVASSTNTAARGGCYVQTYDGTKRIDVYICEYFVAVAPGGTVDFYIQGDFKSQEHCFRLYAKGADYYLEIDGKLAVDGTGRNTAITASNQIIFGDSDATSAENADAIWSYMKFYTGGMLLPVAANGGVLSEAAYWSGDQSAILPALYNAGSPVSVKKFAGLERNHVGGGVKQREVRQGIASNPSTGGSSPTQLADMEAFVIGSEISIAVDSQASNSAGGQHYLQPFLDGIGGTISYGYSGGASAYTEIHAPLPAKRTVLGLHKPEGRWFGPGGATVTSYGQQRCITIESRS